MFCYRAAGETGELDLEERGRCEDLESAYLFPSSNDFLYVITWFNLSMYSYEKSIN